MGTDIWPTESCHFWSFLMSPSEVQGHWLIPSFFKYNFSYSCASWQDFNKHSASCGSSATVEILVKTICCKKLPATEMNNRYLPMHANKANFLKRHYQQLRNDRLSAWFQHSLTNSFQKLVKNQQVPNVTNSYHLIIFWRFNSLIQFHLMASIHSSSLINNTQICTFYHWQM